MPRTFLALAVLAALASLPLGGSGSAEPSRLRIVSRDPAVTPSRAPSKRAQAPLVAAGVPAAAQGETRLAGPDRDTEEVVERYPNGRIKIKRHVTQDNQRNYINHGPWTLFDMEGNPVATGYYKQGKRDGAWSRLQPKASKRFDGPAYKGFTQPFVWEAMFTNDVLNGKWTMIDAEGRQIRNWEFQDGRLEGNSIDWFPDGKKRRELNFIQGIPQGELREWDDKGKLIVQLTYRDGRPHRPFLEKHSTGDKKLQGWHLGPKEMVRVTFNWWEGTMRVDLMEVEGKEVRHGPWTAWHENGVKQYEGEYQNDKPVGLHTWWYANGQKQISGHFVGGRETGRWTWWHDNGFKSIEGEFIEGKREGHWTAWHRTGQKSQSGKYAAGKKTGQWATWDEAGKFLEWRDHAVEQEKAQPQVSQPGDDSDDRASIGPLSHKKDVPELLQRWMERNGNKVR
jgi:antitoxin component YwqK of YwqJK toxin-antitoxin module